MVLHFLPTANSQPGFLTAVFKLLVPQVPLPDVTKSMFVSPAQSLLCHCNPNCRQKLSLWPSLYACWTVSKSLCRKEMPYTQTGKIVTYINCIPLAIAQHLLNHLVSLTVSTLQVELDSFSSIAF